MLTRLPGSSLSFKGGVIAYANDVKVTLLGVNPEDLEQEGAVSAVVAAQMALGVKTRLGSDWGVSIAGLLAPAARRSVSQWDWCILAWHCPMARS